MLKVIERILAAGLVAIGFSSPPVYCAMSETEFTGEFVSVLAVLIPEHSIEMLAPLRLSVTSPSGEKASVYLDNAYAEYLRDTSEADAVFQRYANAYRDTLALPDKTNVSRIVPVIKDRRWLDDMLLANEESGLAKNNQRVFEPLNEQLVIVYAEDTSSTTRYFSAETLNEIGIPKARLRELAVANLRRLLPDIEWHRGEHVSMLTAGGDYVASLMLFDELWQSERFGMSGDIVVAVPSRDVLLITSSHNSDGIAKLKELVDKAVNDSAYYITRDLFVYRNGRFELFTD